VVAQDKAALERGGRADQPSVFTCPDCGGVLWELHDGPDLHFRCHVGHTYTPEGLRSQQQECLEEALWTALRSLEESAALARRLAHRAQSADTPLSAQQFEARANDYEERAAVVRNVLHSFDRPPVPGQAGA
jgi:two-component system chemotaxis response regulator CheB